MSLCKKPRRYSPSEKERFFALLAERGNVSSVANGLGIVGRLVKWAYEAGIFTGKSVDATRTEFLLLRESGFPRSAAADTLGVDKRSAQDWDKGVCGCALRPSTRQSTGRPNSSPASQRHARVMADVDAINDATPTKEPNDSSLQ